MGYVIVYYSVADRCYYLHLAWHILAPKKASHDIVNPTDQHGMLGWIPSAYVKIAIEH